MYIEAMLGGLLQTQVDVTVTRELAAEYIGTATHAVQDDYLGESAKTIKLVKCSPVSYHPIFALRGLQKHDQSGLTSEKPGLYALEGNYPNPFNPTTSIQYSLPEASRVVIVIYNALGQQVAELVNGDIEAGYHSVQFNAGGLASGMYFCRMQAGNFTDTRKLILAK